MPSTSEERPPTRKSMRTKLDDYERGWLECLYDYSYTSSEPWAENGVRYVGTTGRTYREAATSFLTGRGKADAAAILYPERRS